VPRALLEDPALAALTQRGPGRGHEAGRRTAGDADGEGDPVLISRVIWQARHRALHGPTIERCRLGDRLWRFLGGFGIG
jgi:hypothetical protein